MRPQIGENELIGSNRSVLPLSVRGRPSQVADLTQWRAADDRLLTAVTNCGTIERRSAEAEPRAPLTWEISSVPFDGVPNHLSYFGYNAGFGGTRVVPAEPTATYTIEADYFDGHTRTTELYSELTHRERRSPDSSVLLAGRPRRDGPEEGHHPRVAYGQSAAARDAGGSPPRTLRAQPGAHLRRRARRQHRRRRRGGTRRSAYFFLGADGADDAVTIGPLGNRRVARFAVDRRPVAHFSATSNGAPGASLSVGVQDNEAAGVRGRRQAPQRQGLVARAHERQLADIKGGRTPTVRAWRGHARGRLRRSAGIQVAPGDAGDVRLDTPAAYLSVVDSDGRTLLLPAYSAAT